MGSLGCIHQFFKLYDRFPSVADTPTSLQGWEFGKASTTGIVVMCANCGERRELSYVGRVRVLKADQ